MINYGNTGTEEITPSRGNPLLK